MVDLNVRAMTAMTNLVIPYMPAGGRILNTSSIASFCPTPRMTVYGASTAYVSSFTVGLSEELKFDEKTGKPLNNNLLDYKLSTFMDHPTLQAAFVENPEPTSPYGTKALGEPPACSPAPAIRNAILNATGVAFDACPITPHVLYRGFKEAGLIED